VNDLLMAILSPFPASALSISDADFLHCTELARKNGVEMLFYSRLKKHYAGTNACVDAYLKKNKNSYLMAVAQSMRQEAVGKDLIARLGNQGIPVCIIKGNDIARSVYEDPNCRSSVDIDVLVKMNDFFKADVILRDAHYSPDNQQLFGDVMYHAHHKGYYDPAYKIPVELHWRFGVPYFFRLTPDEIWRGIVKEGDNNVRLSPEMLLIILLIHHHYHAFRELKILVDLLWAFYKYDASINWHDFIDMIHKMGLTRTTMIVISQLESLWPEKISCMKSIELIRECFMHKGWKVSEYLVSYFSLDLERTSKMRFYMDKFVARFALDGFNIIILSFIKTLFPPVVVIKELYHSNNNLMLTFNYVRFIYGRLKLWLGGW